MKKDPLVKSEDKELKERMDHLELQVLLEQQALKECLVLRESKEKLETSVLKVHKCLLSFFGEQS